MSKFLNIRKEDIVRKELTYNELGFPIGADVCQYSTFIGVLARRADLLPWDCHDWRTCPLGKKQEILNEGCVSQNVIYFFNILLKHLLNINICFNFCRNILF